MPKITRTTAETLPLGTTLHHTTARNAAGTPLRARVNGKCRTWKTRPEEFRLPMKHGLRDYFYITEANAHEWELPPDTTD